MSQLKHTPGPWRLGALPPPEWRYIIDGNGNEIAAVAEWNSDGSLHLEFKNARANARLIAAAPELLEALQNLADTSRSYLAHFDSDDIAALESARAVICKAIGEDTGGDT